MIDLRKVQALATDVIVDNLGEVNKVEIPINLPHLLTELGLSVVLGSFKDEKISGAFDQKNKKIYLASKEGYNRKACTIGHFLGHYFLHPNMTEEILLREFVLPVNQELEEDASKFAAALLMPNEHFKNYLRLTSSFNDIARIFGVTNVLAEYRLRNYA